mgnify:FL=1
MDFIKFVGDMKNYIGKEIELISHDEYPIGQLGDVVIHFVHFDSIEDAREKWKERSARINYDNIFIMMADRDGCTDADIEAFDKLPFKNKVIFTHKNYPQYKSAFYIKGFDNQPHVGLLYSYKNIFGKRYYDAFDYVKWFNSSN